MHDQVMHALHDLGVEAILGDRVVLPQNGAQLTSKGWSTTRLTSGRSVRSDLRIFATGQKPNSGLYASMTSSQDLQKMLTRSFAALKSFRQAP